MPEVRPSPTETLPKCPGRHPSPEGEADTPQHPLLVHVIQNAHGYADLVSTQGGVQVVVLTALPVEYDAMRRHLHDRSRSPHPMGIEFEVGTHHY